MYGMVHAAARAMALEQLGTAAWAEVLTRSDLTEEHFLTGELYSDEVTMTLIAAISDISGLDPDTLLEAFGEYWIGYTARSAYGPLFNMIGDDLDTFLDNLDTMHSSIQTTMPGARMPSFEVLDIQPGTIEIMYRSERTGLEAFVTGLLRGLLIRFDQKGTVDHRPDTDGTRFTISRTSAAVAA